MRRTEVPKQWEGGGHDSVMEDEISGMVLVPRVREDEDGEQASVGGQLHGGGTRTDEVVGGGDSGGQAARDGVKLWTQRVALKSPKGENKNGGRFEELKGEDIDGDS